MRARLIKLLLCLCALLPLPLVQVLGALLGRMMVLFARRTRRITYRNIERCLPELSPEQRRRLGKRCLIETGKTATEMGPLWFWSKDRTLRLIRDVSGKPALDAALAAGRGALLAAPHLGNWEVVGLYSSSHYAMTSLYLPPRLGGLDHLITGARERFGARLVPADATGVRSLLKALRQGDLLGLLPDQEPRYGNGIFVPFFGIPAYTMTLLARLAQHADAPIFIAYAERLRDGSGFHLHYLPLVSNPAQESIESITGRVNAGIESCVRRIPDQYQWGYKRFHRRPAGEPRFY